MKLTLEAAKRMLNEAERKAKELGILENIAIVDDGGNLLAFHRMDRARIAGIQIAIDKAWTALAMQTPTAALNETAVPNGPLYGINTTNQGRIVILKGGVPLVMNGELLGAIGVSGSSGDNDVLVAQAAAALLQQTPLARIGRSALAGPL
ncbi:GlcG/HbpS family heme-binding protein [Paenibacillus sp. GCM10023250]|uniref:GlcG/HbpS family heme-binding protein n=1 Tax=Paenibacillus sp. GCM10023250 TaxID=3252648 RepID=UPI003610B244